MSTFVLMAGGTGGHLFPAMALAQELRRRGHIIHLMTDERVNGYGGDFPAREIHIVPSATPSTRNPVQFVRASFRLLWGSIVAIGKLRGIKADAVIGFGGYPTFPPFFAASILGIPGLLHEQNAVMGRANRALGQFADILALSFAQTAYADKFLKEKVVTGNPVRDRVREFATKPYPLLGSSDPIRLTVFGGSQGARAFADLLPPAIALLSPELRSRLRLTQQCRAEDLDRVAEAYRQAKVNVELAAFFDDLPDRMARSHLVIARSGASTVAELCVLGRPAILIPLPGSIDGDQKNNAMVVDSAGGGWIIEQATITPQSLATRLEWLLRDAPGLATAARAAKALGQPRAVEKLADLAESQAHRGRA
ncbi:MAG TPA: undecaprenyldiphospho-muramoylpentapeptide beta-N-acetylglucosaminyltransferase [Arsenicitalea sp.]|jgi:UDP-N-acetylglucosamine--N-acetylmuramyl-(pentapeptide) pyrophosphoryl-undecaprenol N-acetylglucosamine transferase|nr:undecaprenyldiphospho-muramoylpentapeptide beta-N-acetylglucosaminyltransferase [Arsenicitalea sp.]